MYKDVVNCCVECGICFFTTYLYLLYRNKFGGCTNLCTYIPAIVLTYVINNYVPICCAECGRCFVTALTKPSICN